jgi:hypothetical protein
LSYFTQQIDQNLSSLQQQLATLSLLGQVLDAMVEEELIRQRRPRGVTVYGRRGTDDGRAQL